MNFGDIYALVLKEYPDILTVDEMSKALGASTKTGYPEEMMFVKFLGNGNMFQEVLPKGIHYVEVALNEVPLFIRKGCAIPVADFAESVPDIKEESIRMVGYEGASYEHYTDDGVSRI